MSPLELIASLIGGNYYIIVAFCYVVGWALKTADFFPDKFIPLTLMAVGGIAGGLVFGLNGGAIITGALCAFASTGINQLFKQLNKRE